MMRRVCIRYRQASFFIIIFDEFLFLKAAGQYGNVKKKTVESFLKVWHTNYINRRVVKILYFISLRSRIL